MCHITVCFGGHNVPMYTKPITLAYLTQLGIMFPLTVNYSQ